MNEILLAVFGAGISIFLTELIEYHYKKQEADAALFRLAERVISALVGLRPVVIETFGSLSSLEQHNNLIAYFEEEYTNQNQLILSQGSHAVRNRLIREMEQCDIDECDYIAANPNSHFNRYISRVKDSIRLSAGSYLSCFDYSREEISDLANIISNLTTMPFPFSYMRGISTLESITKLLDSFPVEFSKIVGLCRLFMLNETEYSEMLACCLETEGLWYKHESFILDGDTYYSDNKCARELFCAIYDYASHTSPKMCRQYRDAAALWFSLAKDVELS